MERYKNLSRASGVYAFEAGTDFIEVQFTDRHSYLYTYRSAGKFHIEKMKMLAVAGLGLNSYINNNTKNKYERKF